MKLQFDSEKMPIKDRDNYIVDQLSKMEKITNLIFKKKYISIIHLPIMAQK